MADQMAPKQQSTGRTKLSDTTIQQVVAGINQRDPHFLVNAGNVLDQGTINGIIEEVKKSHATRSLTTALSLIMAEIRSQVRIKTSEEIKALVVGQRDTTMKTKDGKNIPGRVTFLRVKGGHFEIPVWGSGLTLADKSKVSLTMPCLVTAKVEKVTNETYGDSYNLISVEAKDPLEPEELARKLLGLGVTKGSKLTDEDKYKVVIVQGKIKSVQASPIFEQQADSGEPCELDQGETTKRTVKTGELDVLMPDSNQTPILHPVLQITLAAEGNTMLRLNVDRRKYLHGVYWIADLMELCEEAVAKYPTDPAGQAHYIEISLGDRPVIAVGSVMNTRAPKIGESLRYVGISTSCIVDFPENLPVLADDPGQTTLPQPKENSIPKIADTKSNSTVPATTKVTTKSKAVQAVAESETNPAGDRPDNNDIHEAAGYVAMTYGIPKITDRPIDEILSASNICSLLATRFGANMDTVEKRFRAYYEKKLLEEGKSAPTVIPQDSEKDESGSI